MRVCCVYFDKKISLESFAQCLFAFSPRIAVHPHAVFLDITGTAHLFSEEKLIVEIKDRLRLCGLQARFTFSQGISHALALAIYQKTNLQDLPIEALGIFANVFDPPKELARVYLKFRKLGVSCIGELLQLPRAQIHTRFGKISALAMDALLYDRSEAWPLFSPPEILLETLELEEDQSVQSIEPLMFIMRPMLERLFKKLHAKSHALSHLQLHLTQESYSMIQDRVRTLDVELSFPAKHLHDMFAILTERLDRTLQVAPLMAPVVQIKLCVLKSVYTQAGQHDFFSKKAEEQQSFERTVNHLRQKLGNDQVFLANLVESHLPEKAWKKSLDPQLSFGLPIPKRPLRLLKKPKNILREQELLRYRNRAWRIAAMEGPERISGEWWSSDQTRDYFRVSTQEQQTLWVYQHPGTDDYFLHGFFD